MISMEKEPCSPRRIVYSTLNGQLGLELSISPDSNHTIWGFNQTRTVVSHFKNESQSRLDWTPKEVVTGSGQSYSFDPDAKHFWAARGTRVVRHSSSTGDIDLTFEIPRSTKGIHQVLALTSRAQYVLAANRDGQLDVIDAKTAKLKLTHAVSEASLTAVALSHDESLAVAGTLDGRVVCVSLPDGKEVAAFTPHTGRVNSIALSPDKSLMATAGNDGKLRLWTWSGVKWDALVDLPTGRKAVKQVHIDAVGKKLYVLLAGERGVRVWHLDKLKEVFDQYGVGW